MKDVVVAGGIVLGQNEKVLIVNQCNTSWSLPKGHVEVNEDKFSTAKREIYEESGIEHIEYVKYLGSYCRNALDQYGNETDAESKTIHMYLFTIYSTTVPKVCQ